MLRRWARVIGINFGILIGGIVIAELIFGNWIFGPDLGYFLVPRNVEIRHDLSAIYPGGGIAVYTRDKYGLRGDYGGDPRNIDILVIGGSTTNELYVSDADSWVARLDRMLAQGGYGLKAINAGIDGHSTYGHLQAFDSWFPYIPGLKPKYVLYYIGINEPLVRAWAYELMIERSPSARLWRSVKNESAVYNLYRVVAGVLRAHHARIAHGHGNYSAALMTHQWDKDEDPARQQRIAETQKELLEAYETRLRQIEKRTREWGATPIFVTQVRGDSRWHGKRLIGADEGAIDQALVQRLFNGITLRVCRERGDICIDLERAFRADDGDFYDHVHVVATGSHKVAAIIYDGLRSHLQPKK